MKRTLKILFTLMTFLTLFNTEKIGDLLGFGLSNDIIATEENYCEENAEEPIVVNRELLVDVKYKKQYYKELDMEANVPQFEQMHKDLDGKDVIIEGFIIPIDDIGFSLALSKYPFANCFFCGNASPASVLGLYLKDKRERYKIDAFKKFRGTLYLNYDNPYEFFYILKDAREI